jgi:hypothetical protein
MSAKASVARNLAAAFLAGPWLVDGLVERGAGACGRRERWLRSLARRVHTAVGDAPAGITVEALADFIAGDRAFGQAWLRHSGEQRLLLRQVFWVAPGMMPASGAPASWRVPALATPGALAEWLGVGPRELDWFADCHGRQADLPPGPLRHYTYRWLAGRSGKRRLLEMPKQRLKAIQRRLLHEILDRIPPHDAVHGYRKGHSVATYAAGHAGRAILLHFDLRDFFPSIPSSRVNALFRTVGYPPSVARLLTGLCTNAAPGDLLQSGSGTEHSPRHWQEQQRYRARHLPQGAPTSPALANLCAYRLDCRLAALAGSLGARYTRYADDLAFSGDEELERCARRFQVGVCRIALEEGFEVHTHKTRFMRQGVRQQLAGVVVNVSPNVCRDDYERLKAILHNCARHGPASQNREGRADFRAYLAGRIAYVAMLNPARGQRLRAWFERIRWEQQA